MIHDLIRDEIPAVPLWINGHAYLTMPAAFHEVRAATSGALLRRTPLCGSAQIEPAIQAAQAALPAWQQCGPDVRAASIAALAPLLAHYADHFARLIAEESGCEIAEAAIEVERTLALLRARRTDAAAAPVKGPVAVIACVAEPLFGPLALAVPALLAGATLLWRPAPQTPSTLFAVAELTGRCGFPAGVVNVVHGNDEIVTALVKACPTTLFAGAAP